MRNLGYWINRMLMNANHIQRIIAMKISIINLAKDKVILDLMEI